MKKILIIDPIHSFGYLSSSCKELGIYTVAIFSDMHNIVEFNRPPKELFDKQIYIEEADIPSILNQLRNESPFDFIINGSDQHLFISEQISAILTPELSNNYATNQFRQNKFQQQEAMRIASLPHIKQVLFDTALKDYDKLKDLAYPVFAKPNNGGGSIGVFMANSHMELVEQLKLAPNMVNFDNIDYYLIQEYIVGQEILVDSFSVNGVHSISHVCTYNKEIYKNVPVYKSSEEITDKKLFQKVVDFTKKVLDALGYYNGFGHTEIFLTKSGGLYLIELNPRVSGASGFINYQAKAVGLKSQVDLLFDYLDTGVLNDASDIPPTRFSKILYLYDNANLDFTKLDSYVRHAVLTDKKYSLNKGPALTDVRKLLLLANTDKEQLEKDAEKILNADVLG